MEERRAGLIFILLRVQLAIAVAMVLLAFVGGSYLLTFSQLPGALVDATGPDDSVMYVSTFHLIATAALAIMVTAAAGNSERMRLWSGAYLVCSILSVPFGSILAFYSWRMTEEEAWDDGFHYTTGVGARMYTLVGGGWTIVSILSGALTIGAYVGVLSGNLAVGLMFLLTAVFAQWAGLKGLEYVQSKLKTKTFGSPMPELPGAS